MEHNTLAHEALRGQPPTAPHSDSTVLFSRFRSGKDSNVGYGLGLAIVKAICDFHGWTAEYAFSQNRHRFIINM